MKSIWNHGMSWYLHKMAIWRMVVRGGPMPVVASMVRHSGQTFEIPATSSNNSGQTFWPRGLNAGRTFKIPAGRSENWFPGLEDSFGKIRHVKQNLPKRPKNGQQYSQFFLFPLSIFPIFWISKINWKICEIISNPCKSHSNQIRSYENHIRS